MLDELTWASKRPCSSWAERHASAPTREDVKGATSFEASLTENEMKFLKGYEATTPNGIYSLNQDPDVTHMASNLQARRRGVTIHVLYMSVWCACVGWDEEN